MSDRPSQIRRARDELEAAGWQTFGPGAGDGYRSETAPQGFTAFRWGDGGAEPCDLLRVDCTVGLAVAVIRDDGYTSQAHEIVERHLGMGMGQAIREEWFYAELALSYLDYGDFFEALLASATTQEHERKDREAMIECRVQAIAYADRSLRAAKLISDDDWQKLVADAERDAYWVP